MAKRKGPPVTVAPIGVKKPETNIQREGAKVAERALRQFKATGYRAGDGPTPERLLRAGGAATVQTFSEVVEISKGDKFEPTPVDMTRITIGDDPFTMLCRRKVLAPKDPSMNLILCTAGLRYRQAWRTSGFETVKSIDFERVGVSSNAGMFASEASASAFQSYTRMKMGISHDYRVGVDAIVLEDRDPTDVGREIGAYQAEKQAIAVAVFVLRRGLEGIARVLGLLAPIPVQGVDLEPAIGKNPLDA